MLNITRNMSHRNITIIYSQCIKLWSKISAHTNNYLANKPEIVQIWSTKTQQELHILHWYFHTSVPHASKNYLFFFNVVLKNIHFIQSHIFHISQFLIVIKPKKIFKKIHKYLCCSLKFLKFFTRHFTTL